MADGLSYREAGVDRTAAERAKDRIAELVESTRTGEVLANVGGFGGLYRVPRAAGSQVLVASADGVGTKLKVAMRAGRHDTVGEDLVNHCVDDILVEGARPLFFLDYIGMGRLEERVVADIVEGIARGCVANGCALLGGETAEMPDFYAPGEYDLAGFIVGLGPEDGRPGAKRVREGAALVGLASNGFHTNGYSLLRRLLFDRLALDLDDAFPEDGRPVGDVLLQVHRSYLAAVSPLIEAGRVQALAHITGGGIPGNLARSIPDGAQARIDRSSWTLPAAFRGVMEAGGVEELEMFQTFNMGVGMILVVEEEESPNVVRSLVDAGEEAWILGTVERRPDGEEPVVLE